MSKVIDRKSVSVPDYTALFEKAAASEAQDDREVRLVRAMEKAAAAMDQPPKWLPRVLRLMDYWAAPLSPEDEVYPEQLERPSVDVLQRCLETLFRLLVLVPKMPDPGVSLDGEGGIDVIWHSTDLKLKVGFTIGPSPETTFAWGRFPEDDKVWEGAIDGSEEKIKRALTLLVDC